ncbi:5'-nucleotidase-like protein, partial [Leptotrombidium deliense]
IRLNAYKKEINELKTKRVNIFIAFGHSGFDVDKKKAEKVPEVDIVVGGHSNSFLWTGPQPSDAKPDDTKYLGFLNVILDKKGDVLK